MSDQTPDLNIRGLLKELEKRDAVIDTLRAERDAFKADVCAFSREQVQEAVNATLAAETERDAAQQEIAALRRALGDAFADRVVAALSSSPHPQEPQPRVPGCDDRLAPLQPMDAVVAIARPREPQP